MKSMEMWQRRGYANEPIFFVFFGGRRESRVSCADGSSAAGPINIATPREEMRGSSAFHMCSSAFLAGGTAQSAADSDFFLRLHKSHQVPPTKSHTSPTDQVPPSPTLKTPSPTQVPPIKSHQVPHFAVKRVKTKYFPAELLESDWDSATKISSSSSSYFGENFFSRKKKMKYVTAFGNTKRAAGHTIVGYSDILRKNIQTKFLFLFCFF